MPRLAISALAGFLVALAAASAAVQAAELWRITNVIRPSWRAAPLSPAAQALRGAGLAFDGDAVRGPPPLACAAARIKGEELSWHDILGDQTTDAHIDEILADMQSQRRRPYLQRIMCDGHETEFLSVDLHALIPFDGAFLILEQPMDEDQITDLDDWARALHPGFDCAHASETSERLACTDYKLSVAYRKMSEAFTHLHETVSAGSFATIRDAQRGWVPYVDARCNANVAMPEAWTDRRDIANCLRNEAEERTRLLDTDVLTAGKLRLEPRMHAIYHRHPALEDSVVYPWLIAPDQATAHGFNSEVAAWLHPTAPTLTRENLVAPDDDIATYSRRSYSVSSFTERLISLTEVDDFYHGGAHGGLASEAQNFDVRRRRTVTLADVFRPDSQWQNAVTKLCIESLDDERSGDYERDGVAAVVANPKAWTFDRDGAHLFFDIYTITSFSGGASEVMLPYGKLGSYLRPDAPLP